MLGTVAQSQYMFNKLAISIKLPHVDTAHEDSESFLIAY